MRGPPWKSLGMCRRVTNKGKSGFGKASDRVEAEDHRPSSSGILGGSGLDKTSTLLVLQCPGDLHGQGGTLPCKQAKRGRPEGGCGVIPTEIFFVFFDFFPQK